LFFNGKKVTLFSSLKQYIVPSLDMGWICCMFGAVKRGNFLRSSFCCGCGIERITDFQEDEHNDD
jgi:hypothetical protein